MTRAIRSQLRWRRATPRIHLPKDTTLFREGEPAGPMYFVRSGYIRITRQHPTQTDAIEELAILGPGHSFGELASLLDTRRSVSATAMVSSDVSAITPRQIRRLLGDTSVFAEVIASNLNERAQLSPDELGAYAEENGFRALGVAAGALAVELSAQHPASGAARPVFNAHELYATPRTCPACGSEFFTLHVRYDCELPDAAASDFHRKFASPTANPYLYAVWVDPNCLYAGFSTEFNTLHPTHAGRVRDIAAQVVEERWGGVRPDFSGGRSLALRHQALELALAQYAGRGIPALPMANVQHHLAWCARERGDSAEERRWLKLALESYSESYYYARDVEAKSMIRVTYVCGDLALRLDEVDTAITWLDRTVRHPRIKESSIWERMARERWETARAEQERQRLAAATTPAGRG